MNARRAPRLVARDLGSSRLASSGGVVVVDLLDNELLNSLRVEVSARWSLVQHSQRLAGNDDVRGDPDRSLQHIEAGPTLDALYGSTMLKFVLRSITEISCWPLGTHGAYSAYTGEQFLGPHRDVVGCDITVIVVVHDDTAGGHPLWVWPSRAREKLETIRANPTPGRVPVIGRPGQAIILLGSIVPHQLSPMPVGHTRIVAPFCFSASA